MYKAVIFDFDGTLVDSENVVHHGMAKYLKANYDYDLTVSDYQKFVGSAGDEFYDILVKMVGQDVDQASLSQAVAEQQALEYPKINLRPGMAEFIDSCVAKGIKLGVVSNSEAEELALFFDNHPEIRAQFGPIITSEFVENGKPDPEGYQLCMTKLGVTPEETVAVEDSAVGATAALAANLRTYITPNQFTENLIFPEGVRPISELAGFVSKS